MTSSEFIFSNVPRHRIYRHVIFWLVIYVFSLVTYFHPFLEEMGFHRWVVAQSLEIFLHIVTEMIFSYTIIYNILPLLNRKRYTVFAGGIFFSCIAIIIIYYFEHIFLFKRIHAYGGLKFMPNPVALWFTVISFITYFPRTAALLMALKMLKNWYVKQQENQQLIRENGNAELQLLKAQIHPHFLFNTLNNIYSFSLNKSPESAVLVKKLSGTLHYMINECEAVMVSLEKELSVIMDYIDLERIRYGSRLKVDIAISGDFSKKLVAPLLMIPFVENSFKHGASQMLETPWIKLNITASSNTLEFEIINSRPQEVSVVSTKSGIGLSNVKKRLFLLYPQRHELLLNSQQEFYSVKMTIPVNAVAQNGVPLSQHHQYQTAVHA